MFFEGVFMKSKFALPNVLLSIYTAVLCFIYYINGGIFLKAATSLGFLLIAILNAFFIFLSNNAGKKFSFLMLWGAISSFLGDIILNIDFIIGALIFALGHIFYFCAYCSVSNYKNKDFLIGLLIFIPSLLFIIFYPFFNFGSLAMKGICVIYALIISTMLGKAISLSFQRKQGFSFMIAAGSFLFFVSDIALLFYMFSDAGEVANTLCLLTYFPAQTILALSVFELPKKF